jgi:hypothetical protein
VAGGGGGGGGGADFGGGFGTGLTLASVEQLGSGECANGGCGPQVANPAAAPCDNNTLNPAVATSGAGSAMVVTHTELSSFTPVE